MSGDRMLCVSRVCVVCGSVVLGSCMCVLVSVLVCVLVCFLMCCVCSYVAMEGVKAVAAKMPFLS